MDDVLLQQIKEDIKSILEFQATINQIRLKRGLEPFPGSQFDIPRLPPCNIEGE